MALALLCCCAWAFSSCEWGLLFVAVPGLLIAVAPLFASFSGFGTQAQLLWGTWNPSGPRVEPVSPAFAGEFFSTVPAEKSRSSFLIFVWGGLDTQKFIPKADTCQSHDRNQCSHSKNLSKGPDLLSYFCIPFNASSTVQLQSYCKGWLCVS